MTKWIKIVRLGENLPGVRAGVHSNTKEYMDPSNKDWISPRQSTFGSEEKTRDVIDLGRTWPSKTDPNIITYSLFWMLLSLGFHKNSKIRLKILFFLLKKSKQDTLDMLLFPFVQKAWKLLGNADFITTCSFIYCTPCPAILFPEKLWTIIDLILGHFATGTFEHHDCFFFYLTSPFILLLLNQKLPTLNIFSLHVICWIVALVLSWICSFSLLHILGMHHMYYKRHSFY